MPAKKIKLNNSNINKNNSPKKKRKVVKKKINVPNRINLSKKNVSNELFSGNTEVDETNTELNETTVAEGNDISFDKKLENCIDKCNLFDIKVDSKKRYVDTRSTLFQTEEEYQNSFDNILAFSKNVTTKDKENIDVVMFHTENEDGLMSAYTIYKYFENKKELNFIPARPSSSNTMLNYRLRKYDNLIKDKNLMIVDLSFGKANYDYLSKLCKNIIIIDDHPRTNNILKNYSNIQAFIGDNKHCALAYTFKFFNPKQNVPLDIISIDNNDRKSPYPFLNSTLSRYITTYNNFKITHSPYLKIQFTKNSDFKKLEELLNVSLQYKYLIGKLYDEVCNNIKAQVAVNAVKKTFCGHRVYMLNYNDPVLYKMVSREIFTLAERRGDQIDFVVLYGFEFTSNAYKIFVSEKHTSKPPVHTQALNNILRKYGGFLAKGGRVTKYILNFYYPHDKTHDIWDLIS